MSSEAVSHFDSRIEKKVLVDDPSLDYVDVKKIQESYTLGFFLYREQRYQEASYFFRLLVASHPSEAKYWKALGASLQMLKNYEEALNCYLNALTLHRESPDLYLFVYAADCHFALQQKEAGLKVLKEVGSKAKEKNEQRILKHVALMQEIWSK